MKMIISNTLVTSVSASIATLAVHIQALRENHPYFKAENEKRVQSLVKYGRMSVEEARQKVSSNPLPKSLIGMIQNKVLKLGSVTKTDDGIEIEINDNFLIESVELANSLYVKMLKPVADMFGIMQNHEVHIKQFNQRWQETITLDNKIINEPQAIHDYIVGASIWTIKEIEHYEASPVLNNNDLENFILIKGCICTNQNGVSLEVTRNSIATIIEDNYSLTEMCKYVNLPPSLVNTFRLHFNLPLLTDTVVEEVKIETKTSESIERVKQKNS